MWTNIFGKMTTTLNNDGKNSKQQQQDHTSSASNETTVIGKSKFYHDVINPKESSHSPASVSLSMTTEILDPQQNLESIILIWYDSNIGKTNDTKETMNVLREINNCVVFHTNLQAFINHIKTITNEKIFLVIPGKKAAIILKEVNSLIQVDSAFIFCFKPEKYQHLLHEFTKTVGIYSKRHDLMNSLKENAILVEKHLQTFNFYNQHKEKSTRDLSKESAEFLWFQMFKDVILRLPRDSCAKQQMIEFCQHYYRGNEKELKFIDEFKRDYQPNLAIKWYTKETFLYKIVNKALRTEDIEQLHKFRFFIADLSLNLAVEYQKLKDNGEKFVMLYRGLKMEEDELQILKQNEHNLISTNGFLSTSRSKQLAIKFATKSTTRTNVVSVLYEIECNIQETVSIIFADVAQFSDYKDELEVLFDIGSTFEIVSIHKDAALNLWLIKLRASDKGSILAKEYIELNRKEEEETSIELLFGKLLIDMGQYDQSLKYFQGLLFNDSAQNQDIARVNNLIGSAYHSKGDFDKALEYYECAYDLMVNARPMRIKDSARPLTNIGLVYHRKGQYNRALEFYLKAMKILETYYGKEHLKATKTLTNIGNIYTEIDDYQRALQHYHNVLKIQQRFLPLYHIDTAMTLNNIAVVHEKLNNLDGAFEYYQKSLNMKQKLLPSDHPDIALTRHNITNINYRMHQLQIATPATAIPKFGVGNKFQCSVSTAAIESNELEYPYPMTPMPSFESRKLDYPITYGYKLREDDANSLYTPKLDYPIIYGYKPREDDASSLYTPKLGYPISRSQSDTDSLDAPELDYPISRYKSPILRSERGADSLNAPKLDYPIDRMPPILRSERDTDSLNAPKLEYPIEKFKPPILRSERDADRLNTPKLDYPIETFLRPILRSDRDTDSLNTHKLADSRRYMMPTSSSSSTEDEWDWKRV